MDIDVNELWINGSAEDWETALKSYFDHPTVKSHLELEMKMKDMCPQEIKQLDADSFYEFLYNEYFVWKYTANNRLTTTRKQLKRHEADKAALCKIKANIFSAFMIDPENTDLLFCVTMQIHGLGTAGASGLLSILFPQCYGTVDQYLVKALRKVETLPEHGRIMDMNEKDLSIKDAVLLEGILRRKAAELNDKFGNNSWTPRKVDMVLWAIKREKEGQD